MFVEDKGVADVLLGTLGEVDATEVKLTSSIRKVVGRITFVVAKKLTRTVCPLYGVISNTFW